jgi:hypothetical protein
MPPGDYDDNNKNNRNPGTSGTFTWADVMAYFQEKESEYEYEYFKFSGDSFDEKKEVFSSNVWDIKVFVVKGNCEGYLVCVERLLDTKENEAIMSGKFSGVSQAAEVSCDLTKYIYRKQY